VEASGLSPPNSQPIPPKSSSNLPMKSFFNSLYTITKPPNKLKASPNTVDLEMDLLFSSQVRLENQPINNTNLKPRTFANTTVTSKKVEVFTRRLLFCSNLYDASGMI